MKYVLQPMLFAFNKDMTEQELIAYLEELQALDEWWNEHREDMFVQDTTGNVLWEHEYYPMVETLKPLMTKHGIDFIQFGDVNRIIDKMLNKSGRIESLYDELCGMKRQTLVEEMKVHPEVTRREELNGELMKLLWQVFMAHEVGGYDEKSFVVITKGISEIVSVEYEYEEIDENFELQERTAISAVNCKKSLNDFLKDNASPFFLWKTAEKKDDLVLGIRLSLFQVQAEENLNCVYSNYNFRIQDSFYEDYSNGHYKSKDSDIKSTIQAVTDALTEQNMRKVHAIRTGPKGNNPPLVVQDYEAQRRDITTSIKLAYWKKGKEYKIANMREHDFFEPTWEQ